MNMGEGAVLVDGVDLLLSSDGPVTRDGDGYWLPPDTAAWLR